MLAPWVFSAMYDVRLTVNKGVTFAAGRWGGDIAVLEAGGVVGLIWEVSASFFGGVASASDLAPGTE